MRKMKNHLPQLREVAWSVPMWLFKGQAACPA
jgi:hypothetical protein